MPRHNYSHETPYPAAYQATARARQGKASGVHERTPSGVLSEKVKRRLTRMGATVLASMVAATGIAVDSIRDSAPERVATASADVIPKNVYRTGGDGLWLHQAAGLETPLLTVMPEGAQFDVSCFRIDDPVNGNPIWLEGSYNGQTGSAADYYIETHWNTTQDLVNQGIEECGVVSTPQTLQGGDMQDRDLQGAGSIPEGSYASVPKGCYFNMKWPKRNLTFSYEGEHRYYGNAWQAAKNWTDLNAGISITPAAEGQKGDIILEDVSVVSDEDRQWAGKVILTNEIKNNPRVIQQEPQLINEKHVLANKYYLEGLNDYQRTYTFTHEFGHILGIAHIDDPKCNNDVSNVASIMMSGGRTKMEELPFNKPTEHDKTMLLYLYR